MKQSKKLLSIFLAMLMLLGTVSVVGNAALVKSEVAYDSIDNAKLTPEQVADIILDMLDNDVFRWRMRNCGQCGWLASWLVWLVG